MNAYMLIYPNKKSIVVTFYTYEECQENHRQESLEHKLNK